MDGATPRSARGSSSTPGCATSPRWVLAHHERLDGRGVPGRPRRRGRDPVEARILAVVDHLRGDDRRPPLPARDAGEEAREASSLLEPPQGSREPKSIPSDPWWELLLWCSHDDDECQPIRQGQTSKIHPASYRKD